MLDDVLDVSGPAERTGKPRGADLLDGTVTLPLILARRQDPTLPGEVTTAQEAEAVCERIAATGALEDARGQALAHVTAAKQALDGLQLSEQRTNALQLWPTASSSATRSADGAPGSAAGCPRPRSLQAGSRRPRGRP